MKVASLSYFLTFIYAALAVQVTFDPVYDNPDGLLASVSCSDGSHGLLTRGYKTFTEIPTFPSIGGSQAVAGWNSPSCGTCWELTYTNSVGKTATIIVTAVDHAARGFNIGRQAYDVLTGNKSISGVIDATYTQLENWYCGL
ncbi:immunomodulatory protein [Cyathus striatus]|nr:immunomodulatory protein [Cyathus striatus]